MLFVHSSKFEPQTSPPFKQSVYASIHSAFASNVDVDVDEDVPPLVLIFAVIVGMRDDAVPITLGRAVTAYAPGKVPKTATNPIVFFRNCIRLTPLLLFYYNTIQWVDKEKYVKKREYKREKSVDDDIKNCHPEYILIPTCHQADAP